MDFVEVSNGRRVLVFYMPASPGLVTLARDRSLEIWIRTGDRVEQATGDALERLMHQKGRWPTFLDRVCMEASRDDIDETSAIAALSNLGLPLAAADYLEPDQPLKGTATPLFASVAGPRSRGGVLPGAVA